MDCVFKLPHKPVVFVIEGKQGRQVFAKILFDDRAVDLFGDSAVEGVLVVAYLPWE